MKTCELFSSRDTLEEANAYAEELIQTLPLEHRTTAYTLHHVTLNTAITLLEKASLAGLPRPSKDYMLSLDGKKFTDLSVQEAAKYVRYHLPRVGVIAVVESDTDPAKAKSLISFLTCVAKLFALTQDEFKAETKAEYDRVTAEMKNDPEAALLALLKILSQPRGQ